MTENEGADKERAKELREIAPKEPSEVPIAETQKLFKSSSVSVREDASSVLATIATFDREEARGFIGDFVSMLDDESAEVRYHGAYSLSAVGEEYPQDVRNATDDLKPLLADSDDRVRAHAAVALGTMAAEYPEDVRDVVEDLRPFLNSPDDNVRGHAALVFANLAAEYPEDVRDVVSDLEPLLTKRDIWSKRRASLALAHVAEEYPEDVRVATVSLESLLEDEDQETKENAKTALRRLIEDSNSSTKGGSNLDQSNQLSSQNISREDLESIDPYNFEQLVADVWEAKGYDTTVRSKSGDKGIDVEAEKTGYKEVIQVKRYNINNKLGSEDVRFYATLYQQEPEANSVVVVTSGEFTKEGRELAEDLKIETLNGNELVNEIQEHSVELNSVLDQEKSNDNGSLDPKSSSHSISQSLAHPFGDIPNPNQDVEMSNLFGRECPVCSSQNSIWKTTSINTGTRLKCSDCNTTWRRIKNSKKWTVDSEERIQIWTAHDGPLHFQSGTPEEWMKGEHVNKKDHPKVTTDEGCFIATAAFGTPHAKEINELREFRDNILLSNTLGEMFVDAYYRFSPPIAEWISESERRKKTTRRLVIDPSLWFVRKIQ